MFGGVFDLFDGALARATGKVSKLGAFMDSTSTAGARASSTSASSWGTSSSGFELRRDPRRRRDGSAFMVSYARAKSESLGFAPGTGMANVGLAPREVRIVILTIGLIPAGLLPGFPADMTSRAAAYPLSALALEAALGLIAILATITTIQRIVATINQASKQDQARTTNGAGAREQATANERARRPRRAARRSASRSSASATAPAASSRAATTTRTRSRPTSSRA